jgi:GTP-binding protein HflX
MHNLEEKATRAALVGVYDGTTAKEEAESLSEELASLAKTLGLEIVARELVHVREKSAKYGIGTGKAAELAEKAKELEADCLVLDWELSPAQQRNWEDIAGIPAIDRRELIIQIFADRAKTREASLQVELAGLRYSLPRLSHKYIDLSRQRGGRYGTKGSGETKLETDRRQVQMRIHKLELDIEEVRKQRALQREQREKRGINACALVGYTNAGKSSLLNAITGAEVFVEDELFATLDPTSRRLRLPSGKTVIFVDTVGFIRRLPHDLVDAFRSTLEEASRASLLIHVLDAADHEVEQQYDATIRVLEELSAGEVPRIIALNKSDRVVTERLEELRARFPGAIAVSAKTRVGLDALLQETEQRLTTTPFPA